MIINRAEITGDDRQISRREIADQLAVQIRDGGNRRHSITIASTGADLGAGYDWRSI
jgi:hypothetical protein